jgi:two-component system sensor histidine kinase MtrB
MSIPDPPEAEARRSPAAAWWRRPIRAWRESLPLRVVSTTFIASLVVMVLGGVLLMQQAAIGVLSAKDRTATNQVVQAARTAQQRLNAQYLDNDTNVNEVLGEILGEISDKSGGSGGYDVLLESKLGTQKSGDVKVSNIPADLRRQVKNDNTKKPKLWKAPTAIQSTGRRSVPGSAYGTTLQVPNASGRYQIYFVFPMQQEQETLEYLQRAVFITGAVLVLLLTLIAGLVSRQVVSPVRAARRAAERLASGHLEDRIKVRGRDDLARLAVSMNNMASELQKQITQLEELSRVQQRFVSDVSHELRTPLTTVRMAAEMLHESRDEFDPATARSAELLQVELDRFESLLNDLLEISRFDAGAAVLATADEDMTDIVGEVVEACAPLAQSSQCRVSIHAPASLHCEVDRRRIQRALRNLLTNAIEHGEQRPIDIYLAGDDQAVAVAVRDHGVGFEAAQAKQVFHRFWRADPARDRRVGGTGLGLSIAMEDIRLHRGWLNAWGRPGRGAQFRLTVPRRTSAVLEKSPLPLVPRDLITPAAEADAEQELAPPAGVADAQQPRDDLDGRDSSVTTRASGQNSTTADQTGSEALSQHSTDPLQTTSKQGTGADDFKA